MEVFRLCREKYAAVLSGNGAALKGARWNSVGVELIYTAANRSLAMAEVAVHFTLGTLPGDYMMMGIFIPDDISIQTLHIHELPDEWNVFPHSPSSQVVGDNFVRENKFCVLQIPSAVTFGDYNFLINPNHKDFHRLEITGVVKFPFDKRIFK